ncbi:hypothetical protein H2202_006511 [Exophiala xenobiotica]|nr:hypothetical protein H2202_006511 [Exophiala xenobiotica]KAK5547929.1 hypothetical protein LTR23_002178 [Chaetothyriales sp. CCFEE 6169]KAK5222060.1 hypothetical protein LTR72_006317 [Exophiala xenobiotica]KAK5295095.1 hypothetical protein LTR14_004265 [Exophiala xenobiotica]KAK5366677.1 hypothetical protein LTS03_008590 [Exophiala xenobiotica]
MDLSPSTWHALGLSVAASFIGLGTYAIATPVQAAKVFGVYPDSTQSPSDEKVHLTDKNKHAKAAIVSMKLLGARDLSIGVAIAVFGYQHNQRAMGTVILSALILCVVDVYEIWKMRGPGWGSAFAVGAAVWMAIGYGLVQ